MDRTSPAFIFVRFSPFKAPCIVELVFVRIVCIRTESHVFSRLDYYAWFRPFNGADRIFVGGIFVIWTGDVFEAGTEVIITETMVSDYVGRSRFFKLPRGCLCKSFFFTEFGCCGFPAVCSKIETIIQPVTVVAWFIECSFPCNWYIFTLIKKIFSRFCFRVSRTLRLFKTPLEMVVKWRLPSLPAEPAILLDILPILFNCLFSVSLAWTFTHTNTVLEVYIPLFGFGIRRSFCGIAAPVVMVVVNWLPTSATEPALVSDILFILFDRTFRVEITPCFSAVFEGIVAMLCQFICLYFWNI